MITSFLFWSLTMTGYYHCGTEGFFGNGGCHYANVDGVSSPEVGITVDGNVRVTELECTTSGASVTCAKAFELFTTYNITPKPCITNWPILNEACKVTTNATVVKGSRVMVYTFINEGECPEDVYVSCRVSGVRVP